MSRNGNALIIPKKLFGNLEKCYEESVAFSELRIDYIEELSSVLANLAWSHRDSELMSFSRYLKHLKGKIQYYSLPNFIRKGVGLVIHISPNNVPLGFAYSFVWGVLSGNSNIVKVPSQYKSQSSLFFEGLDQANRNAKFRIFSQQNVFTNALSSDTSLLETIRECDAKVVWGSNSTVESVSLVQKSVYARSIAFPDRISICVMSMRSYSMLQTNEKLDLAKKFVRDFQSFNQLACSSPWIVYWIIDSFSNQTQTLINEFWEQVSNEMDSNSTLLTGLGALRMAKLAKISLQASMKYKLARNLRHVTVLEVESLEMTEVEAGYGVFYQKYHNDFQSVLSELNERVQTVTYFGMSQNELQDEIKLSINYVPKRVVPIGTALEFEWIWDGRDVMSELTEMCQVL